MLHNLVSEHNQSSLSLKYTSVDYYYYCLFINFDQLIYLIFLYLGFVWGLKANSIELSESSVHGGYYIGIRLWAERPQDT